MFLNFLYRLERKFRNVTLRTVYDINDFSFYINLNLVEIEITYILDTISVYNFCCPERKIIEVLRRKIIFENSSNLNFRNVIDYYILYKLNTNVNNLIISKNLV